ncbi:hypothetical protein GTU73_08825 [Rathayibacter sp. VKM Ac-2804]|uniref:hypothetical protein n=1 Tax=Rathayibacter sp. VKM Ac-2804 TaxID=2609257 RepID=UPI00132EB272|nr:hypothetical protein [Rathayibacter sp. VKM Ac-2804]QHF24104.1 hypothetical protein GTU73_08825 [Rathayibacter sp. VKM Ac-2804]
MTASFARMVLVRKRYPQVDDMGTSVRDYAATPDSKPIRRCWVEPLASTEVTDDRIAVATGYSVAAPHGSDVTAEDIVEFDGLDYQVEGEPTKAPSPTGSLLVSDVLFTIRRWRHGE